MGTKGTRDSPRRGDGDDRIRREARVVGLRTLDVPTLEQVEHRRLQLWIVMAVLLLATAMAMVLATVGSGEAVQLARSSPVVARLGVLALLGIFCAYAIEKELHLRNLTRLLVEERILVTALSSRLGELSALLDAGRAMNSVLELPEVLDRILDNALELLGAGDGSVLLLDGDQRLRAVCVRGNDGAVDAVVELGEGIAGRVAETHEPLLVQGEVVGDVAGRRRRKPVDSAISVPLVHRGVLLGVLNVSTAGGPAFTEHDLRACSVFGEHAASAIANARLFEGERATRVALSHRAFHDPLTGLANRSLFAERVEAALRRRRLGDRHVAVLFLDLDDFKRVNDSLGHLAGDRLLCAVAERLRRSLRSVDTPARLGGDEFAVLLEDLADVEQALATAERIVDALQEPFEMGERLVAARASIGVALAGEGGADAEELLRNADVAMYIAKGDGKSRARLFQPPMHVAAMERLELEGELELAVEHAQLLLDYQPVIELATGKLRGVEALVRWRHPDRGVLGPDAFIPLAEETGLVVGIDRWVLLHATCQARAWQEAFPTEPPISVAVNLSTRQLEHDRLPDLVALALEVSGLAPEQLLLEITESFVLRDIEAGIRRLSALRELGVRLAIDDFGTGYASLSYLKRLPVDVLKIDRSFLDGLGRTPEDRALVKAIMRMADSMGLEVIAEGVERHEQTDVLLDLGCRLAQGWLFSPGLPARNVETLLRSGAHLPGRRQERPWPALDVRTEDVPGAYA